MGVVDSNFEENIFEVSTPTLRYDNLINKKWVVYNRNGKRYLPSFVICKNNADMHLPKIQGNNSSPFNVSNINLTQLFGIHIYNKKFGFYNLRIVNTAYQYPYFGEDPTKFGTLVNYDGIINGYVLNGVSHEDITLAIGNRDVRVTTINQDILENDLTKRLIYTPNTSNTFMPYGEYFNGECYFYIPKSVGVYGYVKCDEVTLYKKTTEEYVIAKPYEVVNPINFYVKVSNNNSDSSITRNYIKIENPQSFDINYGMRYYIKDPNQSLTIGESFTSYVEVDSSNYQYAIANEGDIIIASDGYGEDAEFTIMPPQNLPNNYEIVSIQTTSGSTTNINKYLKISNELLNNFTQVKLFKSFNPTIVCEEKYWVIPDGTTTRNNHSYINYKAYVQVYENHNEENHQDADRSILNPYPLVYQIYQHTVKLANRQRIKVYTEKVIELDTNYWNVLQDTSKCKWIKVYYSTTNYAESSHTNNINNIVKLLTNLVPIPDTDIWYSTQDIGNNKTEIRVGWLAYDNSVNNESTNIDGYYYKYDRVSDTILEKFIETSTKIVTTIDEENYVTLHNGLQIPIGNEFPTTKTGNINGIEYECELSNYQSITSGNYLPYPQDTETTIFELFNVRHTDFENECTKTTFSDDTNNTYFNIDGVSKAFIVGIIKDDNGLATYYQYSPKLSFDIPQINIVVPTTTQTLNTSTLSENSSSYLLITGSNGNEWGDNQISNDILRNYPFTINHLRKRIDGKEVYYDLIDSYSISKDDNLVLDTIKKGEREPYKTVDCLCYKIFLNNEVVTGEDKFEIFDYNGLKFPITDFLIIPKTQRTNEV